MSNKSLKTIGIIGAMQKEVDLLLSSIVAVKKETISGFDFFRGKVFESDIVVVKSGVGKVFAAICTQTLILQYHPDLIVNIGVAGSLTDKLNIFDAVIASKVVQYDMDNTVLGYPLGMIPGINKIFFECDSLFTKAIQEVTRRQGVNTQLGIFATGDKFLHDEEKKKQLRSSFNATISEMEGASIGQVCYVNNIRFGAVRVVSDRGDKNSHIDYNNSLDKACIVLNRIIVDFLSCSL